MAEGREKKRKEGGTGPHSFITRARALSHQPRGGPAWGPGLDARGANPRRPALGYARKADRQVAGAPISAQW
jgi:hypothetical protein